MPSISPPLAPRPRGEHQLVEALRAGDESVLLDFMGRHHRTMLRIARSFVPTDAVAEEVVQDTWEAAFRGLDGFEGRSRLKTWVFRILINKAKSRGAVERRTVPFSSLETHESADSSIDDALFETRGGCRGYWAQAPRPWQDGERRLLSLEVREHLRAALERLPTAQRIVVSLRDVEGLGPDEVCGLLGISDGNQRVLLHRGRTALRRELDELLAG